MQSPPSDDLIPSMFMIASDPQPPAPEPALFAGMKDVSFHVTGLQYIPVGFPMNRSCYLKCFCGVPVVKRNDSIICSSGTCAFRLHNEKAINYYVENVLSQLFDLPCSVEEFIRTRHIIWLVPACTCNLPMRLAVWESRLVSGELYWNAVCSNDKKKCDYTYVPGRHVLPAMREYLRKNPELYNEMLKFFK